MAERLLCISGYIFGPGQCPRAYFRTRVFIILGYISNCNSKYISSVNLKKWYDVHGRKTLVYIRVYFWTRAMP